MSLAELSYLGAGKTPPAILISCSIQEKNLTNAIGSGIWPGIHQDGVNDAEN
jgi:hypothetical protein